MNTPPSMPACPADRSAAPAAPPGDGGVRPGLFAEWFALAFFAFLAIVLNGVEIGRAHV